MSGAVPLQCRFYARGTCRFGENCRFSHGQQQFGQQQQPQYGQGFGGGRVDPNLQEQVNISRQNLEKNKQFFVDSMFKDLLDWEKGNIWPFSSYGPIAGKPSIPQFEDISVEELRWSTLQNGGLPPSEIAQKSAAVIKTRMFILQNHAAAKSLIDLVMDSSKSSVFSAQPTPQSSPPTNFFSSQQQQVMSPTLTGLIQSQSPSRSIFGGSGQSVSPSQVFGGQNTGGFFGTTQTQPNIQAPMPASSFSFSLGQQQFQSQPTARVEGSGMDSSEMSSGLTPAPAPTSNIQQFSFSQAMAQNVQPKPFSFSLGQQQPGPAPLVAIPPTGTGFSNFNLSQTGQSLPFGSTMTKPNPTPGTGFFQSASHFGSGIQMQPQSAGPPAAGMTKFAYSQLSDLTAEEIKEYEADNFSSCESIPLKPPAREMCMRN